MKKKIKITKRSHVFKGYTSTYSVEIFNSFNLELQLKDTESSIKKKLIDLFSGLKGFKFVTTLVLEFEKIQTDVKTLFSTFYFNSKSETVINASDIDNAFQSFYSTII